jgi:biotin carboxyl carrier protein
MRFQFDVADRERTVEIERHPQGYRVAVDGRAHSVDAVPIGGDTWSLIIRSGDDPRPLSIEAVVVPQNGDGSVHVYLKGHRIAVSLRGGLGRRTRAQGGSHGTGPQRVTSPMPGKVVRLLVAPGDRVEPRQGLVVVEAMKMENELRAARQGRVREVLVEEGQSVEAGTTLLVVE